MEGSLPSNMLVLVITVLLLVCDVVMGKECTDRPTQLSSHSLRFELLSSDNETWKEEVVSHYHLTPTDDNAWSNLKPRKALKEQDKFDWEMMYTEIKNYDGFSFKSSLGGDFLKEVSLKDVRLPLDSLHGRAQQTNLEYLLMLDVDRLVWSFRSTAGLPTPGTPYGGWEAPTVELRGHFVGHYLSASAKTWASTDNDSLKEKMSAVVSALSACQEKMGTGYLSAFPSELFDRFEAIQPVWAPYYTIHKILAGLLDQYTIADNLQALNIAKWMAEYFYSRVQNVILKYSIERHYLSLNEETGGMNDVLYRLYSVTNDVKHLTLAHLFDKPCFLGLLAVQADELSGFHANTHIPVVVGSQMRYEFVGDPIYKEIGRFFMEIVNASHSYATGGTSVREFWSDPRRLASTLETENEESCTTYNMLKVARNLFRSTKEAAYADYYERALTNGVLSIQRGTDPGVMIYMLPLGRGVSKAVTFHKWGTQFDSFWCCYGTGIESFSKLGDSIYFEEGGDVPTLYIVQYISSVFDWNSGGAVLNQTVTPVVSWDPFLKVIITSASKEGAGSQFILNLRVPSWTHLDGAKATLNSASLSIPAPGNFLRVENWTPGNELTLQLPIELRTEAIKDDRPEYASLKAILYGPYLLAGYTNDDWDTKTGSASSIAEWVTPIPGNYNAYLVSFSQETSDSTFALMNSNQTITTEYLPEPGTNTAVHATFRLILDGSSSATSSTLPDVIGKSVMIEPFDFPGMLVAEKGKENYIGVVDSANSGASSIFRVVAGLDGRDGAVSLESENQKGCFMFSDVEYRSGLQVKLSCKAESSDAAFEHAASFTMRNGISQYHPISFVAKGARRNFLLAPLLSFRDEYYTVYFNVQA